MASRSKQGRYVQRYVDGFDSMATTVVEKSEHNDGIANTVHRIALCITMAMSRVRVGWMLALKTHRWRDLLLKRSQRPETNHLASPSCWRQWSM